MKPGRDTTSDLGLYVYKISNLSQLLHTQLAWTKYPISSGTDRQTDGQAQPYIPSFSRGIINQTTQPYLDLFLECLLLLAQLLLLVSLVLAFQLVRVSFAPLQFFG